MAPAPKQTIARLNDATFERTIARAQSPILVTFTAPVRCPGCRWQKPAIEALALDGYPVFIVDVEQEDSQQVEARFGGRGVPYHNLYSRGQLVTDANGPVEHLGPLEAQKLLELFERGAQAPRTRLGGVPATVGGVLGGFGRGD